MGLRDRREQRREDREEFGRGGSATVYRIREKAVSLGDDFWIEDSDGNRCFKVNGKALRIRETLAIEDSEGNELVHLQSKALSVRDKITIERINGVGGVLVKDLVNVFGDDFTLKLDDGRELRISGNLVEHDYEIHEGDNKVGQVSKKWFRVRDTYGVQIEPGFDEVLLLAAAIAVDQQTHDVG